ncbi:MAG: hypothetical protein II317_00105 [Clostridia bacterium]|nr:hypothetical protein [Clostridia bacterium]
MIKTENYAKDLKSFSASARKMRAFVPKFRKPTKVVIPSVAVGVMFVLSPMTTISLKTYGEVTEKIRIYIDKTIYILHSIKKTR